MILKLMGAINIKYLSYEIVFYSILNKLKNN